MRYGKAAFNNDGTTEASVLAVKSVEDPDPRTFQEAVNGADGDEWMKASEDEIKSLKENQTSMLVPRSQAKGRKVLTNKWVFRTKTDSSGNL
ncbi:hypothetical protein V1525DRAFT_253427 [Lipomyces kononenkoae]|uniref:Uncharacterized protein n=1 Tax=Lipomyces kononenkoae TaxID=34357 RepID=A0ACC3SVN1_LIPKO